MIDSKYCYSWDWDKEPMTFNDLIECLRRDLELPDFTISCHPIPDNENDYQIALNFLKSLKDQGYFK